MPFLRAGHKGLGAASSLSFGIPPLVMCGSGCVAGHFTLSSAGGRLSEVMSNLRKEQVENRPVEKMGLNQSRKLGRKEKE